MKASIKFRDERKPLLRAKIPLNVMSFPFQSAITAGESKELSLNLSTFFDSGPSLRLAYRPNDSQNPFSVIFKTGIGHFGSPAKSPLTMSAEFNLVGNQNPSFFIHFNPDFGDFSLKKSHSSESVKGLGDKLNGGAVTREEFVNNLYTAKGGIFAYSVQSRAAAGMVEGLVKGTEVSARTVLPIKDIAVMNFRWGLKIPKHEAAVEDIDTVMVTKRGDRGTRIGLPLFVMNKIGIECITKSKSEEDKIGPDTKYNEVADACFEVKKQLDLIQAENGLLSKALGDLRADIAAGKMDFLSHERSGKYYVGRTNGDMKGFAPRTPIGEGKDDSSTSK